MNSVSIPKRPRSAAISAASATCWEVARRPSPFCAIAPSLPRGVKPTPLVGYGHDLLVQSGVRRATYGRTRPPDARAADQPEGDRRRRGTSAGVPRAGCGEAAQGRAGDERPRRTWRLLALATCRADLDGRRGAGAG